ncbi:chemotaxis protein CheB [Roseisolibacter agri]|uniref:protein-glutamate methylesterase n=1 Tax=Roseisolibacter agri TaxID=2014610 RepID=A0AA37QH72_9BACT|nr:chemotaxis protein CheB [Roseisolibacter agri]GLC26763.1 chemotaxis protein CheB [Roseisolibacter agri]
MPTPPLVVVGASAGGVEALSELVRGLPADLPAAVLVVLHIPAQAPSVLPRILARAGHLPADTARDGDVLQGGRVYVAPPDCHMIVDGDRLRLVRGPRENGHRPAIDPLFRSAARMHGGRVAGVVLTGNLGDGSLGLAQVKDHGGVAIVQSPAEALYPGMPRSALTHVDVDYVLPVAGIATTLVQLMPALAAQPASVMASAPDRDPTMSTSDDPGAPPRDEVERVGTEAVDASVATNEELGGRISHFTCPECSGSLWEIRDGRQVRFRCRVGHSYSEPALVHAKDEALEAAMWTAVTALEENASLSRRLAERFASGGRATAAHSFERRAQELEARARAVREVLEAVPPEPLDAAADAAAIAEASALERDDVTIDGVVDDVMRDLPTPGRS